MSDCVCVCAHVSIKFKCPIFLNFFEACFEVKRLRELFHVGL